MKKNYTFRLEPDLVKRIDKRAEAERRNRTNMIEVAIHHYLEKDVPSSCVVSGNHES